MKKKEKIEKIIKSSVKKGIEELGADVFYNEVHQHCAVEAQDLSDYKDCTEYEVERIKKKKSREKYSEW